MFIQKIGPWEFNVHGDRLVMTAREQALLLGMLPRWSHVFPKSSNLAEKHFSVPSAIIRFDYMMSGDTPCVCEIEERPAGLGVTSVLYPDFLERLLSNIREQEHVLGARFAIYVTSQRDGTSDDDIFAERSGIPLYRGEVPDQIVQAHAWYVRADRNELEVSTRFTSRALSTIEHEGNKHYGVELGLWKKILSHHEPEFSTPFVVKPGSGSRFEEVLLYHPNRKQGAGFATKSKVLEAIRSGRVCFLQGYHEPERVASLGEAYRRMRRAYFVWSPEKGQYVSLGGLWVATPNARIHGTRASVFGVLTPA